MSNVATFESLVEQGMALPFEEQAKYINQTFTGKLLRSLQTDEFRNSIVLIKRAVQLIGPHLSAYSSNKRQNFIMVIAIFDLGKSDFETIFSNLPSFKVVDGTLIGCAYRQHGLDFALAMTKIAHARKVLFQDLYESLIDIVETDRDRIFLEFPDSIRLPHRITSLSPDEIKRGIHKTENEISIKNEIIKTLDSGKPFSQFLKEIEDGIYMPHVKKDFLVRVILSVSTNQVENVILLNEFSTRLEIGSSQFRWMRLVNECAISDEVPASTWKEIFILLFDRDQHDLQNWFETLRSTYPISYWRLFEFEGIDKEIKSLALFRALAQHLCYTRDPFEFPRDLKSDQNLNNLATKLFNNYLNFVQEGQYTHSFSLLMKFVACFAQLGDASKLIQLGRILAMRNGQVELLGNHNEFLIEVCICHCKEGELDKALEIYKKLSDFSDPSYSYLEFLLCDLARDLSAIDVPLLVFNRHLLDRKSFDNRVLTSILRSQGFFINFTYRSISIFKELIDLDQQFDDRSLHAFTEAVRFSCDLKELESLVAYISTSRTEITSEILAELMYGYLHNGQVDEALEILLKIASIDGYIKTAAKYGSLLSTYEEPKIDAVIRQWDS